MKLRKQRDSYNFFLGQLEKRQSHLFDLHKFLILINSSLLKTLRCDSPVQRKAELVRQEIVEIQKIQKFIESQQDTFRQQLRKQGLLRMLQQELSNVRSFANNILKLIDNHKQLNTFRLQSDLILKQFVQPKSKSLSAQLAQSSKRLRQVKAGQSLSKMWESNKPKSKGVQSVWKCELKRQVIRKSNIKNPDFKFKENLHDYFQARLQIESKYICQDLLQTIINQHKKHPVHEFYRPKPSQLFLTQTQATRLPNRSATSPKLSSRIKSNSCQTSRKRIVLSARSVKKKLLMQPMKPSQRLKSQHFPSAKQIHEARNLKDINIWQDKGEMVKRMFAFCQGKQQGKEMKARPYQPAVR